MNNDLEERLLCNEFINYDRRSRVLYISEKKGWIKEAKSEKDVGCILKGKNEEKNDYFR